MPTLEVRTPYSEAEVYLHGAHVTHFQRKGERPVLFMSKMSRFESGAPIRGGVPVILPWFGPREGAPPHGFARLHEWDLKEITLSADGSSRLRLRLPDCPEATAWPPFTADFIVTVGEKLQMELAVSNTTADRTLNLETCLHTYFAVGNIAEVEILGLKGVSYLDTLDNRAKKVETADAICIASEVDRIYVDSTDAVEIVDRNLRRRIRVEKEGSLSTVVWNPWIAKSQRMPDFGNEEYPEMVCVESGNVGPNSLTLPPGKSSSLKVTLSTVPL